MRKEFELDPAKNPVLSVWVGTQSGDLFLTDRRESGGRISYSLKAKEFVQTQDPKFGYTEARLYNELSPELKARFAKAASPELLKMFQDYYEKPTNQFEQIKPDEWSFVYYYADTRSAGKWWLSKNKEISGNIRATINVLNPRFGNPTLPDIKYSLSFKEDRLVSWTKLNPNDKAEIKKDNPELYQHFEQYYQQKASVAPRASRDVTAPDNFYIFHGVKEDKFYIVEKDRAGNQHNTNVGNWTNTQVTIIVPANSKSYTNLGEFIHLPGSTRERLYKANAHRFNEWIDFYQDKKDLDFDTQSGSDYDIDKKKYKTVVIDDMQYLSNPRTKSEQKRMADVYRGEIKPGDYERIVDPYGSPDATDSKGNWLDYKTTNSPNQQINEKFNLPTKVRSLPRGERLTSTIIQSPPRKNPAPAGYLKYGTTVSPGRKPVRGR